MTNDLKPPGCFNTCANIGCVHSKSLIEHFSSTGSCYFKPGKKGLSAVENINLFQQAASL